MSHEGLPGLRVAVTHILQAYIGIVSVALHNWARSILLPN